MSNTRRQRRSVRAILLDPDGFVLLIRFEVRRASRLVAFWATPGGSVEDGETDAEAVRRELIEELGVEIPLDGPVHVAIATFDHEGIKVDNTDLFYFGRCARRAPKLSAATEAERTAMREMRWWSVEGIEDTAETIFPPDLAKVVRTLVGGARPLPASSGPPSGPG